ncbi:hypothetical protein [Riemerella anatipestifer]|uniref:Uncharacterized protein n=3 Tax=Riemerella anatipestifer TaxID=34085 RepID=E4TCL5_RIEAD|nr:hypothetical protein [Riemerella anatipestifer]ADQ82524.1 hypothetical protein Riean_1367 [Riemerella anatipestifer ATCC 11845 = DSM 15868]ADZ11981.1 hypothetical protein RIA_0846 [Riemerella anatipestifer RA-GD]AFD56532.1 hypothetical protein RA0C_1645 [Riemerella anatipestifer ATCC 11845 = DSM 15868]AGC39539.1 hypothetical protein G148_0234 [Riemerella anatipestifer RA-CH-2]AKP69717.1 hypothetical protein CG08_1521 [Riemerella anatipestifer]
MRTKFFISTFILIFLFSFANDRGLVQFPKYSKDMDKGFDCSAKCWFNSCAGAGTCSCACGFFSCDCAPSNPKEQQPRNVNIKDISINEGQYKRISFFASLLKSMNNELADNVYNNLALMLSYYKNEDNDKFNEYRNKFVNALNNLDGNQKKEINLYFIKVGAKERI